MRIRSGSGERGVNQPESNQVGSGLSQMSVRAQPDREIGPIFLVRAWPK